MSMKQVNERVDSLSKLLTKSLEKLETEQRQELFSRLLGLAKQIRPVKRKGFTGFVTPNGISRTALCYNLGGAGWEAQDVYDLFESYGWNDDFGYAKAYCYKGRVRGTCELSKGELEKLDDRLRQFRAKKVDKVCPKKTAKKLPKESTEKS